MGEGARPLDFAMDTGLRRFAGSKRTCQLGGRPDLVLFGLATSVGMRMRRGVSMMYESGIMIESDRVCFDCSK